MCFLNKETINKLMSFKKPCILKYVKRKTKINLKFVFVVFVIVVFDLAAKAWMQYLDYFQKWKISCTTYVSSLHIDAGFKKHILDFKGHLQQTPNTTSNQN